MSFFEFPHTRTYDSDLGWLIREMKELLNEYDNLISWVNSHEADYESLLKRVTKLEQKLDKFQQEIDDYLKDMETRLSRELYVQLQEALVDINRMLYDMRSELSVFGSQISNLRIYVDSKDDANFDILKTYIDQKCIDFINSLPDYTTVNVFNPVRGIITTIQIAVDDLYDMCRFEGLTAFEYDYIGITASEYDSIGLTAIEYDQMAKYYFEMNGFLKNPFHYMTSPFTGELVPLATVITELAALHKLYALTSIEYDNKELTASEYDALDLGAYDYDWHGAQLIA